jgi:hypothetical protein
VLPRISMPTAILRATDAGTSNRRQFVHRSRLRYSDCARDAVPRDRADAQTRSEIVGSLADRCITNLDSSEPLPIVQVLGCGYGSMPEHSQAGHFVQSACLEEIALRESITRLGRLVLR